MIMKDVIQSRHQKLDFVMSSAGMGVLALNPGPSLTYLTGLDFHLSERPVVLFFAIDKIPAIVLPELETGKLKGVPFEINSFPYGENPKDWAKAFQQAEKAIDFDGKLIGVESRRMRILEYRFLEDIATKTTFMKAEDVLANLRMYKDPKEISAMRAAVKVAQNALEATIPLVKIGMTERELAGELVVQLLRQGSQPQLPFYPIVSFGPNCANPHATPTDRKLTPGDLMLIDWGATVDNYFSDLTRTFAVGGVEPDLVRVAEIVHEANAAARSRTGPGVPAGEVDLVARTIIEKAGFGDYFIHRTGHGLGLEGHEEPYIRNDNAMLLEPGMTFTIEPGIYLPDRGGVRIEDDVIVTVEGVESFSNLPRELVRII